MEAGQVYGGGEVGNGGCSIDARAVKAYDAGMQKVLIVVGVGVVVFGVLFLFMWRITGPVFGAMPELNGLLMVITVLLPLIMAAAVMRIVWTLCSRVGRAKSSDKPTPKE